MKQILLVVLLAGLFIVSIPAQTKQTKTPVKSQKTITKPTPQKEITIEKAVTENGKPVVLKSNGTWEFASGEVSEKSQVKPCDLVLKDAPAIKYRLKLGMTKADVQRTFNADFRPEELYNIPGIPNIPSTSEQKKDFPFPTAKILPNRVIQYTFYEYSLRAISGFWGLESLVLEFFNDELHSIKTEYAESAVKFSNEEFKSKLNESFKLPVESWNENKLVCREFELSVSSGNTLSLINYLTLQNIEGNEKLKRQTFKP
ncbi:MAG: hypothetical protein WA584_06025 [Pyrinomonadaceae bacterium]